jgi:hypothetical protein
MKTQFLFLSTIALTLLGSVILPQTALAGRIHPTPVRCYFFQKEVLDIQNICTYESWSWAGGGGAITWEDGVTTKYQYGLQGRGTQVCLDGEIAVDGVCGKTYQRSLNTLKRISDSGKSEIICIQLDNKSVCWKPPF